MGELQCSCGFGFAVVSCCLQSFHVGDETIHLDDWCDHKVSVDFLFYPPAEIAGQLTAAGFEIEEIIEREPYPEEHQRRRSYIFARRPIAYP